MNTEVDHNSTSAPVGEPGTIVTLGDMCDAIEASETIPADRKRHLIWALNRTIALAGNGVADLRADPKTVLRQLNQLSPAMTGLSPKSFANLKTLVRAAFQLFAPRLAPARSKIKLRGSWAGLEAKLPLRLRRNLSRFLRFAQAMGWAPDEIGDEHMERFADYLEHEAMLDRANAVVRATRYPGIRRSTRCLAGRSDGLPHPRASGPHTGCDPTSSRHHCCRSSRRTSSSWVTSILSSARVPGFCGRGP